MRSFPPRTRFDAHPLLGTIVMTPHLFDLTGRTAIITGAASGIGRAVAVGLASVNASVTLVDQNEIGLEQTRDTIQNQGGQAFVHTLDITQLTSTVQREALLETTGPQDILVHCAGVISQFSFKDSEPVDFDQMFALHVGSAANLVRCFSPDMQRRSHGRIIFLSSVVTRRSRIARPAYATAKGALEALTRSLALELGPYNITTVAVAPGAIRTGMSEAAYSDAVVRQGIEARVPVKRWGTAEDIAPLAVMLAGHGGAYINGEVITVDGGAHVFG